MKVIAIATTLLGLTTALPQLSPVAPAAAPAPVAPTAPAAGRQLGAGLTVPGIGFGFGIEGNPYGPKAYGMGLNNPYSRHPNPWEMEAALQMVKTFPNLLVRVDPDGDIAITNRFGQEVDEEDNFLGLQHAARFQF